MATRTSGSTSAELDVSTSLTSGMSGGPRPGPGSGRRSGSLSLHQTVVVGCSPHVAMLLAQHTQRRKSVAVVIHMHTGLCVLCINIRIRIHFHSNNQSHLRSPSVIRGVRDMATAATASQTPSSSPSAYEDPACRTRAGHALELASRSSSVAHRVTYPQFLQTPTLLTLPTVLLISKQ